MILQDFKIGSNGISLSKDGQNLDLHNDYVFEGFSYNVADKSIHFVWELSKGEWVSGGFPKTLHLALSHVYLFKARERDSEVPFSEDDCLESIGFIWNNMTDELEGYTKPEPDVECNHLNINFQSGFAIKIGAEKAELITISKALN